MKRKCWDKEAVRKAMLGKLFRKGTCQEKDAVIKRIR